MIMLNFLMHSLFVNITICGGYVLTLITLLTIMFKICMNSFFMTRLYPQINHFAYKHVELLHA